MRYALAPSQSETHSRGATHLVENGNLDSIAKDGGKPKTARTPVFPAGWKDQFGLPYHEHQKSLQINIFDGYAIYGIKDNTVSSIASGEAATPIPGTHRPEVPVQEEIKNG